MVTLKSEQKRSILRVLYNALQDGSVSAVIPTTTAPIATLLETLNAFQLYVFGSLRSGKISSASAGAGHSVNFEAAQIWRAFTPEELLGLAEEFQEIYADALTTLTAEGVTPSDDNGAGSTQIFNIMMSDDRLQAVDTLRQDYTTIRLPWVRLS